MQKLLQHTILLSTLTFVTALNDFTSVFKDYDKGDSEQIKWKDFSTTDLKSLTLVSSSPGVSIPLSRQLLFFFHSHTWLTRFPVSNCVEQGKTSLTCGRFSNTGTYKFSSSSPLLRDGSNYYFSLEWIEKSPSTKTGISKSPTFVFEDDTLSSSSSSKTKSKSKSKKKSKGKFGKLGKGGVIGIAVAVGIITILVIAYVVVNFCLKKKKNHGVTEKGLENEDHELGKQQNDPLMGKDADRKSGDWSSHIPGNLTAGGSDAPLAKYEPYKGQGAAAEYYADAERDKKVGERQS